MLFREQGKQKGIKGNKNPVSGFELQALSVMDVRNVI